MFDLTFRECDAPINHWCDSGHQAPELFAAEPGDKETATRFFRASGKVQGIFCEPCLILATWISRQNIVGRK